MTLITDSEIANKLEALVAAGYNIDALPLELTLAELLALQPGVGLLSRPDGPAPGSADALREDIKAVISREIHWYQNRALAVPEQFRKGYLAGLNQALLLIELMSHDDI